MNHLEELQNFLTTQYSAAELRRLIYYLPDGEALSASLPGELASLSDLAFAAVQSLHRTGALDSDFWSRLRSSRSHFTAQITSIQAASPAASLASSSTLSLILARVSPASRSKRYSEIEFVVRNDSTRPQIITEIRLDAQNIAVDYTPRVKLDPAVKSGCFVVDLRNDGWSDLAISLTIKAPALPAAAAKRAMTVVLSGEATRLCELSEREIFAPGSDALAVVHVFGQVQALQGGLQTEVDQTFEVERRQLHHGPPCGAARPPDTMYICILATGQPSCQKRYKVLREVPAGGADVFACVVSADRSATFDLVVELMTSDKTKLSTRHDGLAVVREPGDKWDVQDGASFTLDSSGAWLLASRKRKPWDR